MNSIFFELEEAIGKIEPTFLQRNWVWIVLICIVVFIVLVYFIIRRKPEIKLSPYELAMLRLGSAKSIEEDDKKYSSNISGLLRDYIESVHNIPLSKRTTEEFLRMAESLESLSAYSKEKISNILKITDKAKFAKENLTTDERAEILANAEEFVEIDNRNILEKKK